MKRYLFYIEQNYSYAILRPVQEAIRRRGGEVAWLPVGREINADFLRPNEHRLENIAEAIAWDPYAVLVPGNEVPNFLPGLKVTMLHGLISNKFRRRDGVQYHFIIRGMFDLYCMHGPNTTGKFEELAKKHGNFRVAETGWCKLDPLFDGSLQPVPEDRPVIMFTSTFTPRLSAAPHLLDTIRELAAKGRWKWIVNVHPKMRQEIVEQLRALASENLEFVETDDIMPLLARADAMLGDTSSVLSEFLVQDKPVVTFRTNKPEEYLFDVQEADKVEAALEHVLSRPPELMKRIKRYVDATHPYRDGKSSERTLDAIDEMIETGRTGLKKRPRNLYRHWKMRRLLNYWKL